MASSPSSGGLASMTFTEVGPRVNVNGTVTSTFQIVCTVTAAQLPLWVTIAVDYDDENGPQFVVGTVGPSAGQGQFFLKSGVGGATITWQHWVPTSTSQQSWVAYAVAGNQAQNLAIPGGWPAGYIDQALTVAAVGPPLATDVTNAKFVPDPAGSAIQYVVNSVGVPTWYYTVQWTLPQLGQDVNFWFSRLTAQQGFAQTGTGTVSGGNTLSDSTNPFLLFAAPLGVFNNPIVSGGTNYNVGDLVWLIGGTYTTLACFQVVAVSSGGVATKLSLLYPGTYTVAPTAGTTSTTTNSAVGSGLTVNVGAVGSFTSNAIEWNTQATSGYLGVGSDTHINGVLTTITGVNISGQMIASVTFQPVSGISNGACSYEIWNPAPNYQGLNAPGTSPSWLGTAVTDSGTANQTGIVWGAIVQYVRTVDQGWGMPPAHNADGSDYLYGTWRFRIYAGSYLMSNVSGGTLVLQTSAWVQDAVQDHQDVTPANVSNPLDLTQTNLTSVSDLFFINPDGKFDAVPAGVNTAYIATAAVGAAQTNLAAINAATGALAASASVNNLQQTPTQYLSAIPVINVGGSLYAVGDVLSLVGGTYTTQATVRVVSVIGNGEAFTLAVVQAGAYTVLPSNPVSTTGGTGSGCNLYANWAGGALNINNGINVFTQPMYLSQGNNYPTVALLNTGIFLFGAAQASGNPTGLTSEPWVAIQSTGVLVAQSATGAAVWIDGGSGSINLYSSQTTSMGGTPTPNLSAPFVSITSNDVLIAQSSTGPAVVATATGGGAVTLFSTNNSLSVPYVNVTSSGILVAESSTGAAVLVTATSGAAVTLFSVNNSVSSPYVNVTSSGILVAASSTGANIQVTSSQITITGTASGGYYLQTVVTSAELLMQVTNGSTTKASMALTASGQTFNGPLIGSGTYATYWYQTLISATGITLQTTNGTLYGPSSLVMTATNVSITQGTLVCTLNSTTTTLDNAAWGAYASAGLTTLSGSGSTQLGGMVSPGYIGAFYGNLPSSPTAFGLMFVLFNGSVWTGGVQVEDASGNQGYLYPKLLELGGNQVVTTRQSGPGSPSGFADATAQTWCNNLYLALSASGGGHGLIS